MTGGAYTSPVKGGFKDVSGILQFDISLVAGRAMIVHNAAKRTADKFVDLIED